MMTAQHTHSSSRWLTLVVSTTGTPTSLLEMMSVQTNWTWMCRTSLVRGPTTGHCCCCCCHSEPLTGLAWLVAPTAAREEEVQTSTQEVDSKLASTQATVEKLGSEEVWRWAMMAYTTHLMVRSL